MKKQIFTYFGLYFSLINILSFPMEPNQNQERQLIVLNQPQGLLMHQWQQNIADPIINNPQASSSSAQTNDLTTNNNQTTSLPDTSALCDEERATKFIDTASPEARNIVNMILNRNLQTNGENNPIKGFLNIIFSGPTGTGKTSLLNAIIVKLKRKFIFLFPEKLIQPDQFNRLKVIPRKIKPFLKNDSPCVIAIDDIDKFHNPRANDNGDLEPDEILAHYMDEAERKDRDRSNPHFIFLATTNDLKNVSRKLCSRSIIVEIKYPEYPSRLKILTDLIINRNGIDSSNCDEEFIKDLAQKTENLAIRHLLDLVYIAIWNSQSEETNNTTGYCLSQTHLKQALKQTLLHSRAKNDSRHWWYTITRNTAVVAIVDFALKTGADWSRNWLLSGGPKILYSKLSFR